MLYCFLKIFGEVFVRIFFRFKVKGLENIPHRGGVILAANHRSYLDPPLVALRVPRRCTFLSKTVFYRNPFASLIFKSVGVIPLRQERGAVGLIGAMRSLKKGNPLVLFPEGTRNTTSQPFLPGSPGVSLLAEGSGAPVIPVYLEGTEKALPYRARFFRPAAIKVIYGKPLTFSGQNYKGFAQQVMAAIAELKAGAGKPS